MLVMPMAHAVSLNSERWLRSGHKGPAFGMEFKNKHQNFEFRKT